MYTITLLFVLPLAVVMVAALVDARIGWERDETILF